MGNLVYLNPYFVHFIDKVFFYKNLSEVLPSQREMVVYIFCKNTLPINIQIG